MNLREVFIIIPTHNRKELLRKCLLALADQTFKDYHAIVVDDGSSDGTKEMLSADFKDVIIMSGSGDLWWTGATNLGLSYALKRCSKSDLVLTLNDDTFFGKDYIESLVNFAMINPHALIGSVLLQKGGGSKIIDGGYKQNWLTAKRFAINKGMDISQFPENHYEEASTLSGRGTLIPAEAFLRLGLYDDKHLPQHGDIEFSRRAFLNGYDLLMYYGAHLCTYESSQPQNIEPKDLPWVFLDKRSARNIKERFWFSFLCAKNVIYGAIYFICDLLRVIVRTGGLFFKNRRKG